MRAGAEEALKELLTEHNKAPALALAQVGHSSSHVVAKQTFTIGFDDNCLFDENTTVECFG